MNPLLLTDGYKTGHHQQYPKGTTLVYSNFTPRSNKYAPKGCNELVVFGTQMVMQQLHEAFQNDFFSRPKDEVCGEMKRELSMYLGTDYDVSHFEALHDLGYLPICVKALPEGTKVPMKVPVLTIYNTVPEFYWITNYLETILSNLLWKPMTSATIAHQYRKVLTKWMEKTDKERAWFIDWQGHDFSMRGMDSVDAVISSGLGHLTSFLGSDSLPTIYGARKYYGAEGMVCGSVNATEHSVMCAGGKEDEVETFRRLLETYPTGILSIVSDTWDLWKVCTEHVVTLKEEIMSRDGKLVIRPDSGNPVDILCGLNIKEYESLEDAEEDFEDDLTSNQVHGEAEFTISETEL
jgi:nicotinamide phosphoribosyltransferase